ncbi:hypothetical protein ACHQM5_005821 [Ranunculus cassubicifolius]
MTLKDLEVAFHESEAKMAEEITTVRSDLEGLKTEMKTMRDEQSGMKALMVRMDQRLQQLSSPADLLRSGVPTTDPPVLDPSTSHRNRSNHRESDRLNPEGFPDRPRTRSGETVQGLFMTPDGLGGRHDFRSKQPDVPPGFLVGNDGFCGRP